MALSENALTTVEAVCIRLGITIPAQDSDEYKLIESLINQASDLFQALIDRTLKLQTYVERKESPGTEYLVLSNYPLVSIAELLVNGEELTEDEDFYFTSEDANRGFVYNENAWSSLYRSGGLMRDPIRALRNIKVTYDAGYVLPQDAEDPTPVRTLPYDIEGLVISMVTTAYTQSTSGADGLKKLTEGDLTYEWRDKFTSEYQSLIDKYRRVV